MARCLVMLGAPAPAAIGSHAPTSVRGLCSANDGRPYVRPYGQVTRSAEMERP
jgi:hypothetical protein